MQKDSILIKMNGGETIGVDLDFDRFLRLIRDENGNMYNRLIIIDDIKDIRINTSNISSIQVLKK